MKNIIKLLISLLLVTSLTDKVHANAGILPYTIQNGKVMGLLGMDKYKIWDVPGGEPQDSENPKQTGIREASQETRFVYGKKALGVDLKEKGDLKAIKKASEDYLASKITHEIKHPEGYFTLYLAHVDAIPAEDFKNAYKTPDYEKEDYRWVPIEELIRGLKETKGSFYKDMHISKTLIGILKDEPMKSALREIQRGAK